MLGRFGYAPENHELIIVSLYSNCKVLRLFVAPLTDGGVKIAPDIPAPDLISMVCREGGWRRSETRSSIQLRVSGAIPPRGHGR